ncbi:hypothetical protein SP40_1 [Salmonella phage 40]|nr:hypothetical protein SP40_1 [Salmonella phage 40]
MGAVGGAVEDDDVSLEAAVKREAYEEIHYDLPIDRLEPLLTLKMEMVHTITVFH